MSLSRTEKAILRAASELGGGRITPVQLAEAAGCNVATVVNKLQNLEFRSLFYEVLKNSLAPEVPEILQSFLNQARQGSFKHGKLILEIAEFHHDKQQIGVDMAVSTVEDPFKDDEERSEWLKNTLQAVIGEEEEADA